MSHRPSWRISDCPPWCTYDHRDENYGGDRDHQSQAIYVPAVRIIRQPNLLDTERREVADYLVVSLFQEQSGCVPWLSFGVADEAARSIELSPESAVRLVEALQSQVRTLRIET
jgi:hypothetical protein